MYTTYLLLYVWYASRLKDGKKNEHGTFITTWNWNMKAKEISKFYYCEEWNWPYHRTADLTAHNVLRHEYYDLLILFS